MTEAVKLIGMGIAGGTVVVMLKRYEPIYGMLAALALGAFMLLSLCDMLGSVVGSIYEMVSAGGLNREYVTIVLKVIGIAYISEFGAQMLRDSGENAIASKCELAGKIYILYMTVPVINDFMKMCIGITEAL